MESNHEQKGKAFIKRRRETAAGILSTTGAGGQDLRSSPVRKRKAATEAAANPNPDQEILCRYTAETCFPCLRCHLERALSYSYLAAFVAAAAVDDQQMLGSPPAILNINTSP
jgi:hypothetical protein